MKKKNRTLKVIVLSILPLSILAFLSGSQIAYSEEDDPYPDRGPGRFATTPTPKGDVRLKISSDYEWEDYDYSWSDFPDFDEETMDDIEFRNGKVSEWTNSLRVSYGLSDELEVGFSIPLATGYLEKDSDDHVTGMKRKRSDKGLGDISLFIAKAFEWNDESTILEFEAEMIFRTDTRGPPFDGGEEREVELSSVLEYYWDDIGLIGAIGLSYEENELGVLEEFPYYQLGIGGSIWDELYLAFSMGQTRDVPHSITNMEFSGEYTFDNDLVLEFSLEKDINTPNPVTIYSIGLNF